MPGMDHDESFETLLQFLREERGFDFTGYKRTTLMRRTSRRMQQLGIETYVDYLDHLQVRPEEFTELFDSILINVTGFLRDPDAWSQLQSELLPALLASRGPDDPIRVWSAGCASGEEPYSMAMVLADRLGMSEYRNRVKIYATDVDEGALNQARQATYTAKDVQALPPEMREQYFVEQGASWVFDKDLRRSVIFGRNDLVQDSPISRVDFLLCRNTLMYFNAEMQSRILRRFHFALNRDGVLFLGKAEMLLNNVAHFVPVDRKRRFFRTVPRPAVAAGVALADRTPASHEHDPVLPASRHPVEALRESPTAALVLDARGRLLMATRRAEALFGLLPADAGRPFRDLDVSYRPVELRAHIDTAITDRRTAWVREVEFQRASEQPLYFDIQIVPLPSAGEEDDTGIAIFFVDLTRHRTLQGELELANRQLESAYEELQSTVEELETTNEELQSTVEELETTNEELQSTNEELETMNEELHSTNDELQAINNELNERTREVDHANAFLEAILRGLRAAVIVVDRDLVVQVWNVRAEDMWGVRAAEVVGQHLLNVDSGLPAEQLRPLIRRVLSSGDGSEELHLKATNRRGRPIVIRAVCNPLALSENGPTGAIVVLDEEP